MPLWNIWVLLNEYFLIVVGCVIPYSSCASRSASELYFLIKKGLIVSSLVTRGGEYTFQPSKPLNNFWW